MAASRKTPRKTTARKSAAKATTKMTTVTESGSRLHGHFTLWDLDGGTQRDMPSDGVGSYDSRPTVKSLFGAVSLDRLRPSTGHYYPFVFTDTSLVTLYSFAMILLSAPKLGYFVRNLADLKRYRELIQIGRTVALDLVNATPEDIDLIFDAALESSAMRDSDGARASWRDLIVDPDSQLVHAAGATSTGHCRLFEISNDLGLPSQDNGPWSQRPRLNTRVGAITLSRINPADSTDSGLLFVDSAVPVFKALAATVVKAHLEGFLVRGLSDDGDYQEYFQMQSQMPVLDESALNDMLDAL
jgi:hypothetical protein